MLYLSTECPLTLLLYWCKWPDIIPRTIPLKIFLADAIPHWMVPDIQKLSNFYLKFRENCSKAFPAYIFGFEQLNSGRVLTNIWQNLVSLTMSLRKFFSGSKGQKCLNTDLFLVRISLYSDWYGDLLYLSEYRKIPTRKNSASGHFSHSFLDIEPNFLFNSWDGSIVEQKQRKVKGNYDKISSKTI